MNRAQSHLCRNQASRLMRYSSPSMLILGLAISAILSSVFFVSSAYAQDTLDTPRQVRTVFLPSVESQRQSPAEAAALALTMSRFKNMVSPTTSIGQRRPFVSQEGAVPAAAMTADMANKMTATRVIFQKEGFINKISKAEAEIAKAVHQVIEKGSPLFIHRIPSMKTQKVYMMETAGSATAAIPFMSAERGHKVLEGLNKIKGMLSASIASVSSSTHAEDLTPNAHPQMKSSRQLLPTMVKKLLETKSVQAYVLLGLSCLLIVAGIIIPVAVFLRNIGSENAYAQTGEMRLSEDNDLELGLRRSNSASAVSIDYEDTQSRVSLSDITEAEWLKEQYPALDAGSTVFRLKVQFPKASNLENILSPLSSLFNGKPGRRSTGGILGNGFSVSSVSSASSSADDGEHAGSVCNSPKVKISKMYPEESGILYDSFKAGFQTKRQLLGLDPIEREDEMV